MPASLFPCVPAAHISHLILLPLHSHNTPLSLSACAFAFYFSFCAHFAGLPVPVKHKSIKQRNILLLFFTFSTLFSSFCLFLSASFFACAFLPHAYIHRAGRGEGSSEVGDRLPHPTRHSVTRVSIPLNLPTTILMAFCNLLPVFLPSCCLHIFLPFAFLHHCTCTRTCMPFCIFFPPPLSLFLSLFLALFITFCSVA